MNDKPTTADINPKEILKHTSSKNETSGFEELERSIYAALETYSNVHRGSGHFSMVSTYLFEQARKIVLEYLGLENGQYVVVFCTPRRAVILSKQLQPNSYQLVSCNEFGLNLGVRALVIKRKMLPAGIPFQTGGGTTRLVSQLWVIWASSADRFEAGTPAIINVIAFAKALRMIRKYGNDIFRHAASEKFTATDILYHDNLEHYTGLEMLNQLRQTLIGKDVHVPTREGSKIYTNMDNSASTPTFSAVWDAFRFTWKQPDQVKQDIVQEVKSICAETLGAPLSNYDIIFTSNTTEAINLTAESLSKETDKDIEPIIVSTLLEHSSNDLPWRMVPNHSLIHMPFDNDGFINLNELDTLLSSYNQHHQFGKKRIKLLAISGASNVIGICNNLKEISVIAHRYGVRLLIDAAQVVAHRKIDMEECGIDYIAFSAHKVYAPFGCGVLVARKGLLNFSSAEMEIIRISGEENAGGIAALGKMLVLFQRIGMELIHKEEQTLTRKLYTGMSKIPDLTIYGIKDMTSPAFAQKLGVVVFNLKGFSSNGLANDLAIQSGIGVRYGCLCAHMAIKRLIGIGPKLEQFQKVIVTLFPKLRLPGLVRVSLGIENTDEDVDTLIRVLQKFAKTSISDNTQPNISKANVKQQMNEFVTAAAEKVYS